MCRKPFVQGLHAYGCGQCLPCRINRRRQWTHRIVLESLLHETNTFVTLTYDDEHVPRLKDGQLTLEPKHATNFLKRYRHVQHFRYFLVGEYGEDTMRPHYHVGMFGGRPCYKGVSRFNSEGRCCPSCDTIRSVWGMGNVIVGSLCLESAQYIAGYTVKKMTRNDDERLNGRWPEYARMSRMPGLGKDAMWDVASETMKYGLEEDGDVVSALGHGRRLQPLGRYLRRQLREMCGKAPEAPQVTLDESAKELQPLYEDAQAMVKAGDQRSVRAIYTEKILAKYEGKYERAKSRSRLFRKRGDL